MDDDGWQTMLTDENARELVRAEIRRMLPDSLTPDEVEVIRNMFFPNPIPPPEGKQGKAVSPRDVVRALAKRPKLLEGVRRLLGGSRTDQPTLLFEQRADGIGSTPSSYDLQFSPTDEGGRYQVGFDVGHFEVGTPLEVIQVRLGVIGGELVGCPEEPVRCTGSDLPLIFEVDMLEGPHRARVISVRMECDRLYTAEYIQLTATRVAED